MPRITLIAHNIRSTHNIGAVFRTAEGFGIERIIFSGYSPYPSLPHDSRLPHIRDKLTRDIHKTALGAETMVSFEYQEDIISAMRALKKDGYRLIGLEQDARSTMLPDYRPPEKLALMLGEEVEGLTPDLRNLCDDLIEIPMQGQKESFNVSVAAGIAMYHLSTSS